MDKNNMTMPGAKAPAPASPGMGRGNVPFAPGVMSGKLGMGEPPLAREAIGAARANPGPVEGPPPPGPQGEAGSGGGPGGGPMGPGIGMISPQNYFNVLDALFEAIVRSTEESDGSIVTGIY